MSKRTNAVSISTIGIDTGKNTLVAFWHVTDLAQCLTLVRESATCWDLQPQPNNLTPVLHRPLEPAGE